MQIRGIQIRKFSINEYSVYVACVYVSDYLSGNITETELVSALGSLSGLVINGFSAISEKYSGYDANLRTIDVTEGKLHLIYTIQLNIRDKIMIGYTQLFVDNKQISHSAGSYGYGGGDPWVEFAPMFVFVDAENNTILMPSGSCAGNYSNIDNNITVISYGGLYQMLIASNLPRVGGSGSFKFTSTSQTDINIDDISSATSLNPNPYDPGGETEPGGGEGDFDNTSDPIDFPDMPTLSAVDTGFITLFNPTLEQLKNLSSYMWSDLFDIEGWKKLFANPMDAILGLTIVPVAVPDAGTGTVTVGNISTGISMTKAAGQYVEVDCGTLNINEYWGAYLDYDPYTKAEIYLPFIGIHALSTDDIMKKPVHVKYHIDLLSGACCAYVKCGNSVLYSFVGQCSCSIPTTSADWTNIINGALSIAGSIGSMVATGGASAPMAAGAIASAAVNSLKPTIEKSGAMGGMGGMLGVQQPYIILTRPRQALPSRLNAYSGYPSFMTKTLRELSGYTIVDDIHLENIPATGAELSEIEALLKDGVIL